MDKLIIYDQSRTVGEEGNRDGPRVQCLSGRQKVHRNDLITSRIVLKNINAISWQQNN